MMCKSYYLKRQQMLKEQAASKAELYRKIRVVIRSYGRAIGMQDICQALPEESQATIQRALYELSRNTKSDIWHNGMRGQGSKYSFGLIMTEAGTVEE